MLMPVPGENGIPRGAIVHGACGKWWCGRERAHCGGCCETFSALTAFVRHRRGRRCNPPEEIGLVPREKPYGTLWGLPGPEGGSGALYADRDQDGIPGDTA